MVPASGGTDVDGLIGELRDNTGSGTHCYWDAERAGIASGCAVKGEGNTTSEPRVPAGYTGIYRNWNVDRAATDARLTVGPDLT